jgi:hypothetical protein
LVDEFFGALELAGRLAVGVQDDAGHVVDRRVAAGVVADLDVAKSVEREARLEEFLVAAPGRVVVGRAGGAQRERVRLAVLVEHLGVTEVDRLTGRGVADAQPHAADHVLAEVENVTALVRRHGRRLDRFQLPLRANRRRAVRDDLDAAFVEDDNRSPSRVIEGGRAPAGDFESRIIVLAHQHVGRPDRPLAGAPRIVGRDGLRRAVVKIDHELREQPRAVAVRLAWVAVQVAAVPAVPEDRADRVRARRQQRRDVVDVVRDAFLILRPPRHQRVIAHAPAVDLALVQAECRDVETCSFDCA